MSIHGLNTPIICYHVGDSCSHVDNVDDVDDVEDGNGIDDVDDVENVDYIDYIDDVDGWLCSRKVLFSWSRFSHISHMKSHIC